LDGLEILGRSSRRHFYSILFWGDFLKIIKVENSTPERMSSLAFLLFLVLLSTFFKELHLENFIASSYDPLTLSCGRIFGNNKFNVG
jgi:hypothetical protein